MTIKNELLERIFKKYDFSFSNEDIEELLEYLLNDIEELEDKIKELEEDIQENYRPVPVAEQVAISDHDFI